jgi:hypothetical protein
MSWRTVLEAIRKINLAAIGAPLLAGFGWIWKIVGGLALKILDSIKDSLIKQAEDSIDQTESDKQIEQKAKDNAAKMEQATTDDEFDSAARDSIK